jgi:FAD/FMN-containing dehydrogenase
MRWRDLQDHLDPVGLAVKTMQSYANFTIGGAVSVNAHGRYVGHGALGRTVRALQLVLADGTVVEASPTLRTELFRAAIGGYGGVGVITEVELDLAQNVRIERHVTRVGLDDYVDFVRRQVLGDERALLHNADLLPPRFDRPVAVTWRRADPGARLTQPLRLVPRGQAYALEREAIWAMTELPGGERFWAAVVHPRLLSEPSVKWLNHEASLDVAALEPVSRAWSTYALQEYFVPPAAVPSFARAMAAILHRHGVEALNVSLRHAPADEVSVLPWAATEVFCFVLYFKQGTSARACEAVGRWTRELIEAALGHGGRHYLPYQLHATRRQFEVAYPAAGHFRRIKQEVDPGGRFSNEMWRRYL